MGRKRKAFLENGTGIVLDRGKRRPGYHVRWREYQVGHVIHHRRKFETLQAARRFVTRYNAKSDLGMIDELVPVSLLEAQREFLASKSGSATGTQRQYVSVLIGLADDLGDIEMQAVTPEAIHAHFEDLGATCTQATLNKKARHLSAFFNWAVSQRYRSDNPLLSVPTIRRTSVARVRPPITDETLRLLLDHVENKYQRIAILIAATTGMDRTDIQCLTPEWVDLDAGCLRGIRTKTRKMGVDELHPDLVDELRPLVDQTPRGSRLFPGLFYRPWSADRKRSADWWRRVCRRAGIEGILFRDLRAFAARWMMSAPGVNLTDVQVRLRHASIETTAKHYSMPDTKVLQALRTLPLPGNPGAKKRPGKEKKRTRA